MAARASSRVCVSTLRPFFPRCRMRARWVPCPRPDRRPARCRAHRFLRPRQSVAHGSRSLRGWPFPCCRCCSSSWSRRRASCIGIRPGRSLSRRSRVRRSASFRRRPRRRTRTRSRVRGCQSRTRRPCRCRPRLHPRRRRRRRARSLRRRSKTRHCRLRNSNPTPTRTHR